MLHCAWHTILQVGYTGGNDDMGTVTYKAVCGGDTNHAEAVRVEYTPDTITYEKLLDVFFENHNPTTLNRQGPDVGTQVCASPCKDPRSCKLRATQRHHCITMTCLPTACAHLQYRSAVFYFNDEQRAAAEAAIEKHQPRFQRPIVTQVLPAAPFHEAEEYHQQYLAKQGRTTCTR